MIGRSKFDERSLDMTPNGMLSDANVSPKNTIIEMCKKRLFFIRLILEYVVVVVEYGKYHRLAASH
jgi:hypothetical protein